MLADYSLYPMKTVNVEVDNKQAIVADEGLIRQVAEKNEALSGVGRLLIRASGTESIDRVTVEAQEQELVEEIAEEFVTIVKKLGEKL